jgi:hypothetical protein
MWVVFWVRHREIEHQRRAAGRGMGAQELLLPRAGC